MSIKIIRKLTVFELIEVYTLKCKSIGINTEFIRHNWRVKMKELKKKVFQLIVDNNPGVLSRISGLFSRRGYNIESITAGVTADPRFTRITIVASGDDVILDQIEKQVAKLVDIRDIHELLPEDSVYRELALVKVRAEAANRQSILATANIFRGNIIDVSPDSLIIEITGSQSKVDAFLKLLEGYEILELARTGIAGLGRGTDKVIYLDE
jgi:acetolactate synthase-1/3 small subunit